MSSNCSSKWPSIKIWQRYHDLLIVLVLLALPVLFFVSNSRAPKDYTLVDQAIVRVSAPIQWLVVRTLDGVSDVWHRYIALIDVRDANLLLHEEVARLTQVNQNLTEQMQQLEALKRLMAVRAQNEGVPMVHAQVIAASPSALFRSIRIDRGRQDGLELGAAVVGHEGVVGRVAALGRTSADVMLLIDANSSADVLVQRTRARARVRGRGADTDFSLDAQYLGRVADVEPGDLLVTGGLGRTFPKGLAVGRVTGIERRAFGLYQRAIVEPSVDFTRLEHVMVVVASSDVPFSEE
jgi:rod shape-determining protein MreC